MFIFSWPSAVSLSCLPSFSPPGSSQGQVFPFNIFLLSPPLRPDLFSQPLLQSAPASDAHARSSGLRFLCLQPEALCRSFECRHVPVEVVPDRRGIDQAVEGLAVQ